MGGAWLGSECNFPIRYFNCFKNLDNFTYNFNKMCFAADLDVFEFQHSSCSSVFLSDGKKMCRRCQECNLIRIHLASTIDELYKEKEINETKGDSKA